MNEEHINLGLEGDAFASGDEKKIFRHRDPDKVVKITVEDDQGKFDAGNERYIKAEFYLTKILA